MMRFEKNILDLKKRQQKTKQCHKEISAFTTLLQILMKHLAAAHLK